MKLNMKNVALIVVFAMAAAACGSGDVVAPPDDDMIESDPLLAISSEGGFVPVEYNLGRGPTFSITYGGRFVFPGVSTAEFPGRLVLPVFEAQLSEEQQAEVRRLLGEMGIAEISDEHDGSVVNVADASTEVIKYWDSEGVHRYSVYALGITGQSTSTATAAFGKLFDYLHELAGSVDGTPFEAANVRVVAGAYHGGFDPQFEVLHDWPLEGENPDNWAVFSKIGDETWTCKVFAAPMLSIFENATQTTIWTHPDPMADAENFRLLVRPLHPGENSCEI